MLATPDLRHRLRVDGFTLVEVAIILLALAILSAILVPQLGRFNALARFIRVEEDLMVLCTAMKQMLDDVGESAFWRDGQDTGTPDTPDRSDPVGLLIGDGDLPEIRAAIDNTTVGTGGANWRLLFTSTPTTFTEPTDDNGDNFTFIVDTFANHLIQNNPVAGDRYRVAGQISDGSTSGGVAGGTNFDPSSGQLFNSLFGWRGPYISDRVVPDPWGNRYASNVFALFNPQDPPTAGDGYNSGVVCLSAGPDEQVDTAFNQPDGWTTGDDDVTVVLSGGHW